MFADNPLDLIQFAGSKAMICRQTDRVEPKFRLICCGLNMNVWRLLTFVAEEVQSKSADS